MSGEEKHFREQEHANMDEELGNLHGEVSHLQEQIEKLNEENLALDDELKGVRSQLAVCSAQLIFAREEYSDMKDSLSKTNTDKEILKAKLENLALDDELKKAHRDIGKHLSTIVTLEAKLEAKKRAKSKKICPFYYGRPNGTDFCKEEGCQMWHALRGCLMAGIALSFPERI